MHTEALTPAQYIAGLAGDQQKIVRKLRATIRRGLPKGFKEVMSNGKPGYVVPLSLYPDGYHCQAGTPLPFLNLAAQKNTVALYHMGLYASPDMCAWFKSEYVKRLTRKPDMGKSCIRFKNTDDIPYALIEELVGKMTPQEWMALYESVIKK